MNMEGAKRTPLSARKKHKRKSKRLVRSIVTYLKSDAYLYAPLFSDLSPLPPQIHTPPPSNSESSKAEDLHVAAGKPQITNLVAVEVSTMREDKRNLRSDTAEHTLNNGRISSSKRSLVILDGQQTGEKTVKPDPRGVPIK
ncbi:BnaA10g11670D [Brassica napus]|uniref:BnaA10g11670D protein n=1 Tax=Brassica napus TaxID=3708 RepID=A0A078IMS1_BRANA|nr:BnaA10g11670D [Brassica napus]